MVMGVRRGVRYLSGAPRSGGDSRRKRGAPLARLWRAFGARSARLWRALRPHLAGLWRGLRTLSAPER